VKNLSRNELKRIIQLEMKNLMDEDALFRGRDIPGNDDEHGDYSLNSMKSDCGCGSCPSCNDDSYDFMQRSAKVDPMIDDLLDMGAKNIDIDFEDEHDDHDHHRHSSYMARPQLAKIAKYASHLLNIVDEGEELQDWQESKIAQMSQMIGDVYHSIEYHEEYDDHEDDLEINDLIGMIRTGNI